MAKKSFNEITNPALQFMTQPEGERTAAAEPTDKAADFKGLKRSRKPSTEETKSKRLNLLMLPSVYDSISKLATMQRTSVNELVNSLLQAHIKENEELLQKYNDVFGE